MVRGDFSIEEYPAGKELSTVLVIIERSFTLIMFLSCEILRPIHDTLSDRIFLFFSENETLRISGRMVKS